MNEQHMVSDSCYYDDPSVIMEREEDEESDNDDTQEYINMQNSTHSEMTTTQHTSRQAVNPQETLHYLLGNISQYPLQNVLQRAMQGMVAEIARAQFLADRIEMGDEPIADLHGVRPGIDQDQYERQLSERQLEILVQCQNDEAELTGALVEMKAYYTWCFAESKVTYAIRANERGGWDQVTNFREAIEAEYRKAYQAWMKRQNSASQEGFTPEGAQHMRQQAREKAAELAAYL